LGVGANVSSSLSIGRRNFEEQNHNFYLATLARIDEKAREQATVNGSLDIDKFKDLRMGAYYELYQAADAFLKGRTEVSFGASGIVGEALEAAQRWHSNREKTKGDLSDDFKADFVPF
jgi:hypothetical protein